MNMENNHSCFYNKILEYMNFRCSLGYGNIHKNYLLMFDKYCYLNHPDKYVLTKQIVKGWFLYEINISGKALTNKASAIRCFAKYLGKDSYILPTDYVPKKDPFYPNILSKEELINFFKQVDQYYNNQNPIKSDTMSVLLRLLYCCGLRPNEGRNLLLDDINFNTGELFIRKVKRNKDRLIVASNDVLNLLKQYNEKRKIFINKEETHFFINSDSTSIKTYQLREHVCKCWKKANSNISENELRPLRAYDLRHLFASTVLHKWLDSGENIYSKLPYLRAYMGHEKFEDTLYYIHILPEYLLSSKNVDWKKIDCITLEESIWQV